MDSSILTQQRLRDDLPNLVLLAVLLTFPSVSIIVADWTLGLRGLTTISLLSLATGYLLARSEFREVTSIVIASAYGAFAVGLQQVLQQRTGLHVRERAFEIVNRMAGWIAAATGGGFNQDELIFTLMLAFLFWYVGYNAAWNLFRLGRLWRAVVPPGIALLINLSYYVGEARLELLLPPYLFVTLLLAVRTNILAREVRWRDQQMSFAPGIRFGLLRAGIVASLGLIVLAWVVPPGSTNRQLASAWEERVDPLLDLRATWERLFSIESGASSAVANYYGGQTLTLGGSINLSQQPVMNVRAPEGPRYYWRSKVFDTFDGRTWTTTNDARLRSEFGVLYFEDAGYVLRRNVRQQFQMQIPASRLVYSASQPTSVSLPVSFDVLYIDRGQERGTLNELRAEQLLRDGDRYEAISSISYADEPTLREAGTSYPGWVQRTYLQVPETTTQRTEILAAQLTASYDNPYDKAKAIERWLRENIVYNESISAPPSDVNAVDWVLFEHRQGYCNYYASAMTVMLRTQGIPARIATGFAQGELNSRQGTFQVVESDAHTWVEVYFPRYGWVEFEPTAAQPLIDTRNETATSIGGSAGASDQQGELSQSELEAPVNPGNLGEAAPAALGSGNVLGSTLLLVLILLAIAIMAGGTVVWWESRRRGIRGLSTVARSYALLNVVAPWIGVRSLPGQTPAERASALSARMPEGAVQIHEIAAFYVRERFTSHDLTQDESARADTAWRTLRPALTRRILRGLLRPNARRGATRNNL